MKGAGVISVDWMGEEVGLGLKVEVSREMEKALRYRGRTTTTNKEK